MMRFCGQLGRVPPFSASQLVTGETEGLTVLRLFLQIEKQNSHLTSHLSSDINGLTFEVQERINVLQD